MDATKQQRLTLATSTEGTCILKFFPRIFSCIGSSSNLRLVCSSIAHEVEEHTIFLKIVPYRPEDYSLLSIHNLLVRIITKHPHAKHLDLSDPLLRSNYGREDFVALGWDLYALFRSRLETLTMTGGENTLLSSAGRCDYFSSYRPSPLLSIATAVDVVRSAINQQDSSTLIRFCMDQESWMNLCGIYVSDRLVKSSFIQAETQPSIRLKSCFHLKHSSVRVFYRVYWIKHFEAWKVIRVKSFSSYNFCSKCKK